MIHQNIGTDANNIRKNRFIDIASPHLPVPGQKDATYKTALELVARIDENLTTDRRHYWTRAGELLTSLDQVVSAILDNELMELAG